MPRPWVTPQKRLRRMRRRRVHRVLSRREPRGQLGDVTGAGGTPLDRAQRRRCGRIRSSVLQPACTRCDSRKRRTVRNTRIRSRARLAHRRGCAGVCASGPLRQRDAGRDFAASTAEGGPRPSRRRHPRRPPCFARIERCGWSTGQTRAGGPRVGPRGASRPVVAQFEIRPCGAGRACVLPVEP